MLSIIDRSVRPANQALAHQVEIVVCTAGEKHLLEQLRLPQGSFEHRATQAEPMLLGFECHAALRERLGSFDYYGYLEDDLILRDPWFFQKLAWFNRNIGDENLLLPNRYEVGTSTLLRKLYLDGELRRELTEPFQNIQEFAVLSSNFLGVPLTFCRPSNPHCGCFFLNAAQMSHWAAQPYFLDRDTRFIGPLESAATLGIMRTFRVYKPAPENASFLEVEHFGTGFLSQLRRRSPVTPAEERP